MPRAVAARRIARAMRARRRELVLTRHGKAGVLVARHAPWLLHLATRLGSRRAARDRNGGLIPAARSTRRGGSVRAGSLSSGMRLGLVATYQTAMAISAAMAATSCHEARRTKMV